MHFLHLFPSHDKELYRRLEKLCDAINNDSQTLSNELELSRKLLISYKNKEKRNLKPFLAVYSDLNIKTNKDTKHNQIRRTNEENALKKLIYASILYDEFNFTNKEITEVIGCSRATVKYYLEYNEIKKKYNAVRYNAILNQLNKVLEKYNLYNGA